MLSDLLCRFRALFHRNAVEAELDDELSYHLEREAEKYRNAGASPEEAMRRARVEIGGPEQVRQQCREARGTRLLEDLIQDLRYGVRTLGKSPGFTITVILTLALGIGACTAIFSVVNAVLLRSLPYGNPGRLVYLYTPDPNLKDFPAEASTPSYGDFFDIQRQSHSFAAMTIFEQTAYNLASHDTTERIGGARVDGNFFATLQSLPELGRAINFDDAERGHDSVVVISHALWQSMFAGSMDVLSKSIQLSGKSCRIIGVMPEEFQYPHRTDLAYGNPHIPATQVWVPLALSPQQKADRNFSYGDAIARLKPGVSVAQAQAEMSTIMARIDSLRPINYVTREALIKPFLDLVLGPVRPLMWLLLGAVSFVLLIACGNAANLLMARAASRTHELGVRATLGAGRMRMIRQMLTESLLLGVAGGFFGIALAYVFLHGLLRLNPGNIPRLNQASLDSRVLLFTVALSILTSILFGILPALSASRINLIEFLKSGGNRGAVGSRSRLRSGLIVAEIGLVVILLAGAGLLLRSYLNVESIHTGFSSSTVGMDVHLGSRYTQPQQRDASFQNLLGKLAAIPGVKAAGAVNGLPLSGSESLTFFSVEGYANQKEQLIHIRDATPDYFSAMATPLMKGRFFTEDDTSAKSPVAIVNQEFVKAYFSGRNPIGQHVRTGGLWATVVGVIGDVRLSTLEQPVQPQIYEPFRGATAARGEISDYIAVRSVLPPKEVVSTIRTTLRTIDPNLALTEIHTMGELVSAASARRRFQTTLLTVFAAMALILVLVGFYGLLAYSVRQRTGEIGVRIALGASRTRVVGMILKDGLQLVAAGLLLGVAGALALTRVLASFLYDVRPVDPLTFVMVPIFVLLVTMAACAIPGWKAVQVDPVQALRCD